MILCTGAVMFATCGIEQLNFGYFVPSGLGDHRDTLYSLSWVLMLVGGIAWGRCMWKSDDSAASKPALSRKNPGSQPLPGLED